MNILVIQTGFLGDLILSTAVFSNLKSIYPNSKLTVVCTPAAADLVVHHNSVDQVIPFAKRGKDGGVHGLWSFSKNLKSNNFDQIFCLHTVSYTHLTLPTICSV